MKIGPWEAWIGEKDAGGFIKSAGVDTEGSGAGIFELVCENIVIDSPGEHNARVIGEVSLAAAAPDLLAACEYALREVNGLNATRRATVRDYAISPLCASVTKLVGLCADAIAKAHGEAVQS